MSTSRAEAVAEVLWELKRADKLATYTEIASRAGFNAGANGRSMQTCLKHIRKDWAHLDWWRAISDNLTVAQSSEQYTELSNSAFELAESEDDNTQYVLQNTEESLLKWSLEPANS